MHILQFRDDTKEDQELFTINTFTFNSTIPPTIIATENQTIQ